jgi:AraC-like DNA-binding protein
MTTPTYRLRHSSERGTAYSTELAHFEDVESSEAVVGRIFYPHTVAVKRPDGKFQGTMSALRFGPIVFAELDYKTGVRIDVPEVGAYHINVALRGALRSRSSGKPDVYIEPGTGALYNQDTTAALATAGDSTFCIVALKIDSQALESALAGLLGRPLETGIDFFPEIDLRTGMGRQWWDLLNSIGRGGVGNLLLRDPMVANPLALSLLNGLLLAAGHQYAEALHAPPASVAPLAIRNAVDFIHANLHEPITIAMVATHVGISVRSLHRGFVTHHRVSPQEFIKAARIDRAHLDLIAADPDTGRVADIASRWGCVHLGRFARDYRSVYGVSPSDTLRS